MSEQTEAFENRLRDLSPLARSGNQVPAVFASARTSRPNERIAHGPERSARFPLERHTRGGLRYFFRVVQFTARRKQDRDDLASTLQRCRLRLLARPRGEEHGAIDGVLQPKSHIPFTSRRAIFEWNEKRKARSTRSGPRPRASEAEQR